MPEGDTIHQARLQVAPVLRGYRLEDFWARKLRGYRPRSGQLIEDIRVHGKHLLVDFDRGLTLRVHLGMGGFWRTSRPGESKRVRPDPKLRLELHTEAGVARCYSAPGIETFVRDSQLSPLSNLGPDLVVPIAERDDVVSTAVHRARVRCQPHELMADVLLNQQIAAGIGNVYKSEVLFLVGVNPLSPLGAISDDSLGALYNEASTLLHVHSQPGNAFRVTTAAQSRFDGRPGDRPGRRLPGGVPRHHVYERWRAPCLRCQTPIRRSYGGRLARSSYWCPTCQPLAEMISGSR